VNNDTCRWGRGRGRVLPGKHQDDCDTDRCPGCLPCPERHCQVCRTTDVTAEGRGTDRTCATCVGETRTGLRAVGDLTARMLGEAIVKGINSTAAAYDSPVSNVEAWRYRRASAIAGRIDRDHFSASELAGTDLHPHWVIGTWELAVRQHLDQLPDLDHRPTLTEARTYLDGHLTRLAHDPDFAFDELADDIQRCVTHLENVLYDGTRPERTRVTCTTTWCRKQPRLEHRYATTAADDVWVCPSCNTTYGVQAFREAHAKQLRHAGAQKYLPFREALATLVAQGRNERTVWRWLAPLRHDLDVCAECGAHHPADEYPACPVPLASGATCGGLLEPLWAGDREAMLNAYCDLTTRRIWVWWPDIWARHLIARTRRSAA
jgi:hypothetical protein